MKKYPWISFELNLQEHPLSPKAWMQLGECCSKCDHIARVPVKPLIAEEMHKIYLAKGVQATTAIEGNTLSEAQVRQKIDGMLDLPPSKQYLGQEIENIIEICNEVMRKISNYTSLTTITKDDLERYNGIILKDVPIDEGIEQGKLRKHNVGVGTYRAPEYSDVPELVNRFCDWLNSDYFNIYPDTMMANSIIKAIMAHLYIAWIHPFGDGNGRLARILEFMILLESGVPTPAAQLLSNHYNATRSEYYRKLDIAGKKNNPTIFIEYALQGFLDGLKEQLTFIYHNVYEVSWESYVFEVFRDTKHHDTTNKRRRSLVLELSKSPTPKKKEDIIASNSYLLNEYRKKTDLTLTRDLDEAIRMGLVKKVGSDYVACFEKILAFLPQKRG
jgi:Fic family protein